jgi:hypothetical protein
MPSYSDALAALRDGRLYKRRDEKAVTFKLDADGLGVSIELPGPRIMAETFALPWLRDRFDVYRSGVALLVRAKGSDAEPTPLNQVVLAADLRAALGALPDRPAGRPYEDSRRAASLGAAQMDAYLAAVVVLVRRLASEWKPRTDRPMTVAAPALTAAERKAAQRKRDHDAEEASARWFVELLLDPENVDAPAPGTRIAAADLHAQAVASLEGLAEERVQDGDDWPETAEEYGYPLDPRAPRQRVFYPIADDLLGRRKRGAHGSALAYTILDPSTRQEITMNLADAVIERVVSKLADEMAEEFGNDVRSDIVARLRSGDRLGALALQRDCLAATATDGAVLDLAGHRAR